MGSLGAALPAWFLVELTQVPGWVFPLLALAALAPAVRAAGHVAEVSHTPDPQIVVIDEALGLWVTLGGALHWNWKSWLAAFLLFRLFDVWKPFPVARFEKLAGGAGIVADDLMAGFYGALVLSLAGWFNLY